MKNEVVNIYTEGAQTIITFEFKTQKNYDQIASGALKQECPAFIIPMRFNENCEITMMRYIIDEQYMCISDIEEKLPIEDVLRLYEHFLTDLEECEEWYLRPEGFCYDLEYVYLDKSLKQFKLLYIPNTNRIFDAQALKNIFMNLLGKCPEESGSTIQLQLYKYFYKPQFDIVEFKEMLQVLQKSIEVTTNKVNVQQETRLFQDKEEKVTPVRVQLEIEEEKNDIKEKIEKDGDLAQEEEQGYHIGYNFRNRSQLSQEEIEAMVKSIYSGKPMDLQSIVPSQKQEEAKVNQLSKINEVIEEETRTSFYSAKKVEVQEEKEEKMQQEQTTSFYSRKKSNDLQKDKGGEGKKSKRGLFESVFTSGKNNKVGISTTPQIKGIRLESISKPTRYDLPEEILLTCEDKAFVIGRKNKEVQEEQIADFEFGVEVTPISYIHAQIEKKIDGYYLMDLGSNNGTFINGNKIEAHKPYLIQHEDKIALAIAFSKNSIEYIFREK